MWRAALMIALVTLLSASWPATPSWADPPSVTSAQTSSPACQRPRRRRRARRRAPRPAVTAARREMVRRWHSAPGRAALRAWQALEPRPLVLRAVGAAEPFVLLPTSERGDFDEDARAIASRAFAWRSDGSTRDIHPRLLELLYRAVRRFDAPWATVVSGFRGSRASSRHAQGRAVDVVLPGVSDRRLAAFLRQQGFVGVGFYPVSGFVHVDVRERSYFWVDRSRPSERSRERAMMRSAWARYDAQARARGELAVPDESEDEESDSADEEEATADLAPNTSLRDAGVPDE